MSEQRRTRVYPRRRGAVKQASQIDVQRQVGKELSNIARSAVAVTRLVRGMEVHVSRDQARALYRAADEFLRDINRANAEFNQTALRILEGGAT